MSRLSKLLRDPRLFLSDAVDNLAVRSQVVAQLAPWQPNPFRHQRPNTFDTTPIDELLASLDEQAMVFRTPSLDGGETYNCFARQAPRLLSHALMLAEARELTVELRLNNRNVELRRRNLLANAARVIGLPRFELTLGDGQRSQQSLSLELWERRSQARAYVSRANNAYASALSFEQFDELRSARSGFVDLRRLHAQPVDAACRFDVDVVYTWVNHQDPWWRSAITKHPPGDDIDWDRYRASDELRYSLRSVHQFAPWVRHIYLVTNCSPPSWLSPHPTIKLVNHDEIFPSADSLPTFNSHAIEACLMNIEGLAEHFVYFCDDVFLGRPASKSTFFASNGVSLSFLEDHGTVVGETSAGNESYLNAAINGRKLIEKRFGVSPTQLHQHTPFALKRSVLEQMEAAYAADFERVRHSRFRHDTDISTVSFLYHHHAYRTRQADRRWDHFPLINANNGRAKLARLLEGEPSAFFCINDGGGSTSDETYVRAREQALSRMYPTPAPWES